MTKRKTKVLIMALATVVCCMALLITGTYALFTDTVPVDHHLQAGTLKASLYRTSLKSITLDEETGLLKETTLDDTLENELGKDFTNKTEDNIFGITDTVLVVPMSSFTAEMLLVNDGDVAFNYWIEIVLDATQKNGTDLAEQIKVTLTVGETTIAQTLDNGLKFESEENALFVLANMSETFTVKIEFLDDENEEFVNNDAQEQNVYFDLIVHAVQRTGLE